MAQPSLIGFRVLYVLASSVVKGGWSPNLFSVLRNKRKKDEALLQAGSFENATFLGVAGKTKEGSGENGRGERGAGRGVLE